MTSSQLRLSHESKMETINEYKKLIRRWDSERELSLRRHRTCTTKHCAPSQPQNAQHGV